MEGYQKDFTCLSVSIGSIRGVGCQCVQCSFDVDLRILLVAFLSRWLPDGGDMGV